MVLIIVVVFSFLSKIFILLGALIRALPKYSHGLGVGFGWLRKDYPMLASFSDMVSLVGRQSKQLELFAIVAWSI